PLPPCGGGLGLGGKIRVRGSIGVWPYRLQRKEYGHPHPGPPPSKRGPIGPQGAGEEGAAPINEIGISPSAKAGIQGHMRGSLPLAWIRFCADDEGGRARRQCSIGRRQHPRL